MVFKDPDNKRGCKFWIYVEKSTDFAVDGAKDKRRELTNFWGDNIYKIFEVFVIIVSLMILFFYLCGFHLISLKWLINFGRWLICGRAC